MQYREQFLKELSNPHTKRGYQTSLESWARYATCNETKDTYQSLRLNVKNWLWESGWKNHTAKIRLAAVQSYFKWLIAEGLRQDNPAMAIKLPQEEIETHVPEFPTVEMTDKVIAHLKTQVTDKDIISWRNLAIATLLRSGGFRVSELLNLKLSDIEDNGRVTVRLAKRDKWRITAITPEVVGIARHYVSLTTVKDKIFTVTDRQVRNILYTASLDAGLSKHNASLCGKPHGWRHAWATAHVKHGTHMAKLQKMGGWEDPRMIQTYLNVDFEPEAI